MRKVNYLDILSLKTYYIYFFMYQRNGTDKLIKGGTKDGRRKRHGRTSTR